MDDYLARFIDIDEDDVVTASDIEEAAIRAANEIENLRSALRDIATGNHFGTAGDYARKRLGEI